MAKTTNRVKPRMIKMPGIGAAITAIRRMPFQPLSHQYTAAIQEGRRPWHPGQQLPPWHVNVQKMVEYYGQPQKITRAQNRLRKLQRGK